MDVQPNEGGSPFQVSDDEADPMFTKPYVDVDELRTSPEPHRYINGGFEGTEARFSFYFPPAEKYEGRFHHNTYPLSTSEDIGPFPIDGFDVAAGNLGFTLDSGAYYVQTNMGGAFRGPDPSIAAYRVNAAAARYSRVVAAEVYGRPHRPFGYLYGGSGGAYQAIGAAEHTRGIWDGFMPYHLGSNNSVPSFWSLRLNALRVVGRRGMFPAVVDAIEPGGSGDPYAVLNDEERAALEEATRAGYPLRGWYHHESLHNGYFSEHFGILPELDPMYMDDFWSLPGYLGSDPDASIHGDRFVHETTVAQVLEGPRKRIVLASVPRQNLGNCHLDVLSGAAQGTKLHIAIHDDHTVEFASRPDPAMVSALRPGDRVSIDNSWILAAHLYPRHQLPPGADEYGWNQYRDAAGVPLYPQRDLTIGHFFALHSVGALLGGHIRGKMLLVQSLMDLDALAWSADWYRSEVSKAGRDADFALWFIDHTHHSNPQTDKEKAHTVQVDGALQQGLRDLAAWVEKGVAPAQTRYEVTDAQVVVPARASERKGVQPTVELKAHGGARAEVGIGEPVVFTATIEVPPGMGKIVAAEWDFEGRGTYTVSDDVVPQEQVGLTTEHAYSQPGTYFAGLRITAQREGDKTTPYARVQNLARARVVVK